METNENMMRLRPKSLTSLLYNRRKTVKESAKSTRMSVFFQWASELCIRSDPICEWQWSTATGHMIMEEVVRPDYSHTIDRTFLQVLKLLLF